MIKAVATDKESGHSVLLLGLSFGNLDKFREAPRDTFIKIWGREHGLPFDVVIFSGETEALMREFIAPLIGPDTKVTVEPRRKK